MPLNLGALGKDPTATLSNFWSQYKPQIVGGLAGAGIGAAGLGGSAALSGEEDPEVKSQSVKRNLLLGGVLGGLGGAGIGAGYQMSHEPEHVGPFSKALSTLFGSRAIQGAGAANLGVSALGHQKATGIPVNMVRGNGGYMMGKTIDQIKGDMAGDVSKLIGEGGKPPAVALGNTSVGVEKSIRDSLDRITSNNSILGQWSQKPAVRALGFNIVNPNAELAASQALRPLTATPEGQAAIKRILSGEGGRSMPLLEKALLGGEEGEKLLRQSHTKSMLARMGIGAGAWSGGKYLYDKFTE